MTRNSIAKVTLCILAVGVSILLIWAISRHNTKLSKIKQLPEIKATTIYGEEIVSTDFLDTTKRTALLFFHPECEYCRVELSGILTRYQECRNVQWVFITLAPSAVVEDYLIEYPLDSIPDAFVLREDWPKTYHQFDVKAPPALFIYDENGILAKRYKGATSIKTIVQELQ